MQLPVICYTCDAKESSVLFTFTSRLMEYPESTLAEVLRELADIEPPDAIDDKLPQRICFACTKKLASAYMFVRQARTANDLLMQHLLDSEQVVDEAPPIEDVDCSPPSLKLEIDVENSAIEERADPTRKSCPIPPAKFTMELDDSALYLEDSLPLPEVKVELSEEVEELVTADPIDDEPMDANIFPCIWCKEEFNDWQDLLNHLQCHGRVAEDIPRALMLLKATATPNGEKRAVCKICSKQFNRIVNLHAHIQLDHHGQQHNYLKPTYSITNEMGFELEFSDSETEDECSMSMSYNCALCQFQSKRKYEMMRHQDEVHSFDELPYECKLCIFKCVSQNILEQHKRTQCLNVEKKHICEDCGYKFMWPENLDQHGHLQHSNQSLTEPESTTDKSSSSKVKRETTFYCSMCCKVYGSINGLTSHMFLQHTIRKPYKCDMCVDKKFARADELEIHVRQHKGDMPYFCEMCVDIRFHTADELQIHRKQRIHDRSYFINNDMNNFECSRCGQILSSPQQLKEHFKHHLTLKEPWKYPMKAYHGRARRSKRVRDQRARRPKPPNSSMDSTKASNESLFKKTTESEPFAQSSESRTFAVVGTETLNEPLDKNTAESKPSALNPVSPTSSVIGTEPQIEPLFKVPSDPNHLI